MSQTTRPITGRVPLPTGQAFTAARLSFTLSGWDWEGAEILLPATVTTILDATGALPADFALWANSGGCAAASHYIVTARWEESDHAIGAVERAIRLGTI